jgi:predicted MFS family arabinose efflux permease
MNQTSAPNEPIASLGDAAGFSTTSEIGPPAARSFFLAPLSPTVIVLMVAYALSFLDRQIVNILAEPIKAELHISDKQLGLLIGLSFAIFYCGFGVLIARLSERGHRGLLIGLYLLVWSGATIVCGFANSFDALLATRVVVAVGEAGCLPAAQSLIADYVEEKSRSLTMSMLMLGSPIGTLCGMAMGGIVAQHFGWRAAFIVAGSPGILVAILAFLVIKDPERGKGKVAPMMPIWAAVARLWGATQYRLIVLAGALGAFVSYALFGFIGSFLMRVYKAELTSMSGGAGLEGLVGLILGLILGIGGGLGVLFGGLVADKLGKGVRSQLLVAAMACALLAPAFLATLLGHGVAVAIGMLTVSAILNGSWSGPTYAAILTSVPKELRATGSAVAMIFINLVGLGLGPISVGALSDWFALSIGPAEGLRWALACTCLAPILAGLAFFLALRRTQRSI